MLSENSKSEFASLRVEIIDLNILSHSFVRKINRFSYLFKNTTRHHIFEEFVALRYMENGIILHLTNLDDDSSDYSFRKVSKELNKEHKDQADLKKLNKLLKDYRANINGIKVNHKNHRIAHMSYGSDLNFDEFLNFEKELYPLIIKANFIGDFLWNEEISYQFSLGKHEGILDFRKLTKNLIIDPNKGTGF